MNYREFRQIREQGSSKERRHDAVKKDNRLLYNVHLKTIENRTLMETLRYHLPTEQFDTIIVDYAIRLRKARKNFESNNIGKELDMIAYEAELEERDSEITPKP